MQGATGDLQVSESCCVLAVLGALLCWSSTLNKAVCGSQVPPHMLNSRDLQLRKDDKHGLVH